VHDAGPRCADWAREAGVDPVGTATKATGWLLVEWPLPWPRDAGDVEALAPVREALAGTGIRLQLVVPPGDATTRVVTLHRAPADDGWFRGYDRVTRRVQPGAVVEAAQALLGGDAGDDLDGDEPPDVLVCGHGSRDRCCGSQGTALALGLLAAGIAVRRTSHTGGHRFAPTGVVLPQGTMWAFLDGDAMARILAQRGPLDDLLPRYRGSSGVASPGGQALERAAFAEVGWAWLDHGRREVAAGDGRVRVEGRAPDGTVVAWEAEVGEGRLLPVPACGRPVEDAPKFEAEVVLAGVRRVPVP